MKRDYSNSVIPQQTAAFFYGIEVEKTPAAGMLTLFVVGLHSAAEVLQQIKISEVSIKHVYFGANQSFQHIASSEWSKWTAMIRGVIDAGLWCTLDVEPKDIIDLHESGLCEHRRFIPMISVKLPYINQLNYNATVKIDDTGFEASNPGVWCHRLHDLMTTDNFTNWDLYTEDKLLK